MRGNSVADEAGSKNWRGLLGEAMDERSVVRGTVAAPNGGSVMFVAPSLGLCAGQTEIEPASVPPVPVAKRVFDIVFATMLLVLVLPMLLLIALAILLTSKGPVLFRQPRIGRGGATFTMFKFRTFPVEHVDDLHSRPLMQCPSRLGRLLRRTSLDELPQLFNVLRGDMALVGPRPERPHFVLALADRVPGYRDRHRFPAGITGLAQVNGYWGDSDIQTRVKLDNEYIDNWSFLGDLTILARTISAVVRKARC